MLMCSFCSFLYTQLFSNSYDFTSLNTRGLDCTIRGVSLRRKWHELYSYAATTIDRPLLSVCYGCTYTNFMRPMHFLFHSPSVCDCDYPYRSGAGLRYILQSITLRTFMVGIAMMGRSTILYSTGTTYSGSPAPAGKSGCGPRDKLLMAAESDAAVYIPVLVYY